MSQISKGRFLTCQEYPLWVFTCKTLATYHLMTINEYIIPRLYEFQRNNAIGRLEAGKTHTDVVMTFSVSQSTICRHRIGIDKIDQPVTF